MELKELTHLQDAYGEDWWVRQIDGVARATRLRSLSDEELGAGMAMTLFDGDDGTLAEQLATQRSIENELVAAALA